METKTRKYKFDYHDKQGNILKTEYREYMNIAEAKIFAKIILANSMINDLYKIKVQRIYK